MAINLRNVIGHLGALPASQLYGDKAGQKKGQESRRAAIEQANLRQRMSEDQRRRRLQLGNSLLSGVPAQTGGGVNTNVGIDPAIFAELNRERTGTAPGAKEVARGTYDFGAAMPDPEAGASDAFLSGLFGTVSDIGLRALAPGAGGAGDAAPETGADPSAMGGLSIADLMKLINGGGGGNSPDYRDEFPEK